ncbi:MAG: translation initiation factor IF-2 [Clostridia bacterium]|nr:translation initiation factor IF-2 [Clostridia bacterium]
MEQPQNKSNLDLSNIKSVQEEIKANSLGVIIANLKKLRNKAELVLGKQKAKLQAKLDEISAKAKLEEEKAKQEKQLLEKEAKKQEQAKPAQPKEARPSSDATKTRFFARDNANPNDFKNKRFNQSSAYKEGVSSGQRKNPNGAKFGPNQRPMSPKTGLSRITKPVETFDASKLIKKDVNHGAKKKTFEKADDKKSMNKKALINRGYIEDVSLADEDYAGVGGKKRSKKTKEQQTVVAPKIDHAVITTENLTVKLLAEKTGRPVTEIMSKFLMLGMMVNINSSIDFDSAELIASELGVTLERKLEKSFEEQVKEIYDAGEDDSNLVKRPPVVTVMGHVDHGKTSLLDAIRKTNVTSGEAGGITQHIGAYMIEVNGEKITFIDTPGHAAFSQMRKRGANLTDVAILVVAADDGVMPQTIEAIKYIKEAKVPMIVAINKIDVPTANIDKIKQQLTEHDVVPEEWGGDAIMVPISAKTGQNLDKLLEMILFVSEYQNLRANPNRNATGTIIESKLDKGMGAVATVLVKNGTLKVGDYCLVGTNSGKVRAMTDDKGKQIKSAGPSVPVSILGLGSVPNAGDSLYVVDEKLGKQVISERVEKERMGLIKKADTSVDALMDKITESNFKDYNIIIKGDVAGSVEALSQTLGAIANEEVKVRCIHGGVGAINENDVMLAQASNAVIIGFNVKPDFKAKILAEKYKVNIKFYRIIYEAVEFVTEAIEKLKTPKFKEVVTGHAEVRQLFKASKVGIIAGSHMLDGKISKTNKVRITRNDKVIFDGDINSIQREKNEVKEVAAGFDFGITFVNFIDVNVGDIIESYALEQI